MKSIRLREGKERSLLRRHPWVFEGSVAKGRADAGETVRVEAHDGRFLAWAAFSPTSQIRVRAWSFDEAQRIDEAFFAQRVQRAVALRARLDAAFARHDAATLERALAEAGVPASRVRSLAEFVGEWSGGAMATAPVTRVAYPKGEVPDFGTGAKWDRVPPSKLVQSEREPR